MSYRNPLLTTTSTIPSPLIWALVASTVVHSAFAVLPRAASGRAPGTIADRADVLQVALVRPSAQSSDAPADTPAELVAVAASTMPNRAAQAAVLPSEKSTFAASPAGPATAMAADDKVAIRGLGEMQVDGRLLDDKNRLGELLSRQLSEFPVEVDTPVIARQPITASFPRAAMAAGRQGAVVVWVVVNDMGVVEDVQVAEGSAEFAEAVIAALKDAQFVPARNNLWTIRYPIALEFQFSLGASAVTASTVAVR
ncbi:MAG TPA: TonB family protein [Casimicrobiaceae bacterium]|nr:TonB family protein [Casimicrobiaceae bacterium]